MKYGGLEMHKTNQYQSCFLKFLFLFLILLVVFIPSWVGNSTFSSFLTINSENSANESLKDVIDSSIVNLTILHINDLHGWLNPHDGFGGVATYMGYFRQEGYNPSEENSSIMLVSGGDLNCLRMRISVYLGKGWE